MHIDESAKHCGSFDQERLSGLWKGLLGAKGLVLAMQGCVCASRAVKEISTHQTQIAASSWDIAGAMCAAGAAT